MGEHCAHEHHTITKESVKVLAREDIWLKINVREAIEIEIGQPAINCDQVYELPPSTMNFCCHMIVVKAITLPRRVRHLGLKKNTRSIRKLATSGEKPKTLKGDKQYLSIYIIQFLHADSISLTPPRARHQTLCLHIRAGIIIVDV